MIVIEPNGIADNWRVYDEPEMFGRLGNIYEEPIAAAPARLGSANGTCAPRTVRGTRLDGRRVGEGCRGEWRMVAAASRLLGAELAQYVREMDADGLAKLPIYAKSQVAADPSEVRADDGQ